LLLRAVVKIVTVALDNEMLCYFHMAGDDHPIRQGSFVVEVRDDALLSDEKVDSMLSELGLWLNDEGVDIRTRQFVGDLLSA